MISITKLEKEALSFIIKNRTASPNSSQDDVLNINGIEYITKDTVINIIENCEDKLIYQIFMDKYKDSKSEMEIEGFGLCE